MIIATRLRRGPISMGKINELDRVSAAIITENMPMSATNIMWPSLWDVLSNGSNILVNSVCKSNGAENHSRDTCMKKQTNSVINTDSTNENFGAVNLVISITPF